MRWVKADLNLFARLADRPFDVLASNEVIGTWKSSRAVRRDEGWIVNALAFPPCRLPHAW